MNQKFVLAVQKDHSPHPSFDVGKRKESVINLSPSRKCEEQRMLMNEDPLLDS